MPIGVALPFFHYKDNVTIFKKGCFPNNTYGLTSLIKLISCLYLKVIHICIYIIISHCFIMATFYFIKLLCNELFPIYLTYNLS